MSVVADFCIGRWTAEVACPVPSQPVWHACWVLLLLLLLQLGPCRMLGISLGRSLVWCLLILFLLSGMSVAGLMLTCSGSLGARVLRSAFFCACCMAGPTAAAVDAFFGRGAVRIGY